VRFRTIFVVLLILLCSRESRGQSDANDISAYYGFGEMEIIKLDRGIGALRIADFNGDGRNDIAVVNNSKAKIELLLQKASIGGGEPAGVVDAEDVDVNQIMPPSRFERQSVMVSQRIYSFVCGDLNSDGLVDVAFYGDPVGLYVMLQKPGEAEGGELKTVKWGKRKRIKIEDGLKTPNGLVCADLNNDGASDLAVAGRDAVYVLTQESGGSLSEPVKYPVTAVPLSVEVADLNGDGVNDLVLVTNDNEKPIHVRFGFATGQLGPQMRFFVEKPYALELYNVDGTGGSEVLTVDARSGRLICYEFKGERQAQQGQADWPVLLYPLTAGKEDTKRDLVVGDFDGDGLKDVVISDPGAAELIFYRQKKGLGLAEPVRFPAYSDISSLSAADIDGDGSSELGVLSVKEKVIGISKFEDERMLFPKPIEFIDEPLAMELADVDGDGNTDCVYISKDANDVRKLRVNYSLGEADGAEDLLEKEYLESLQRVVPAVKAFELKGLGAAPEGLKVVDVDQDGLKDVLIFVKYESPILLRQVVRRKFELVDWPGSQASLIREASLHSIAVADADGRTGKELLIAQRNFARSLVFSGGKKWSVVDQYNAKSTENNISAVAVFDIWGKESGGKPAILLLDGVKGQLQILKAGDDKTYRFGKELDVGKWNTAAHLKMLFEPLTGNGVRSIVLFDSEKFALITPPGGGSVPEYLERKFSYETKIKDGAYGNLTVGDINSDGRPDIIMVDYKRNHIEILALDWRERPIPAFAWKVFEEKSFRDGKGNRGKVGVEPRELRVADVTGDGKKDLVTVIHDRIIIYPQD